MSNSKSSKQVLLSVIGVAILVVAVVGVSFAFFNYTRTGAENTVRTGQIFFSQTHDAMELENVFPVSSSSVSGINAAPGCTGQDKVCNDNIGYVDVSVNGYTTYSGGVHYYVTADNVDVVAGTGSTVNVPVSIAVECVGLDGTAHTGNTCTATSYGPTEQTNKVLPEDGELARGYIAPVTATNNEVALADKTNGHIIIKAYLDSSNIIITDTSTDPNAPHIDEGTTNGTDTTGKTVITTTQWNDLANDPISFQIRVVAEEGPLPVTP